MPTTLVIYTTSAGAAPIGSAFVGSAAQMRSENLDFFLLQGLRPHDPAYHFVIVIAGAWPEKRGALEAAVIYAAEHGVGNVEVVWRENTGLDFCSYVTVLGQRMPNQLKHSPSIFSYFIILNGSVRGPILPSYWPSARAWPEAFTQLLVGNVRLAGTSVNCERSRTWLHLQSMILAFTARDLPLFLKVAICTDDFMNAVLSNEIGLSQAFLNDGANLAALQLSWRGADFQNVEDTDARCDIIGRTDVYYPNGRNIGGPQGVPFDPLELMFFKTNRGISPEKVARYSEWQLATTPCSMPTEELYEPAVGPEPTLISLK